MVNHIEHLLMSLLVICKSSGEMPIQIHWHVLTGFLSFTRDGKSLVCILNIAHLWDRHIFSNIFSHSMAVIHFLLMVSSVTKHFHFDGTKSTCIFLSLLFLVSYLRRFCATEVKRFAPRFSSNKFVFFFF